MTGVRTINLDPASLVDELIGHRDGSTVRIALARLVALVAALLGPAHATRADLLADLDWPEGAQGYVRGDATAGYNGVYRKAGASGTGSWTRIGDLPSGAVEAARLTAAEAAITALQLVVAALGTAAAASVDDFATAAQGALAGTAVQPAALADEAAARAAALGDLTAGLAAEVAARGAGEAALADALAAETAARLAALTALAAEIAAEVTARGDGEAALADALAAEAAARLAAEAGLGATLGTVSAALGTETAARTAAVTALGTALGAETDRARVAEALIAGRARPGDLATAYTPDLTGAVPQTAPYSDGDVAGDAALGAALRLTGPETAAPRAPLPLEPGRVYQARWAVRRATDPADPLGDAVEIGLRWLDAVQAGLADPAGTLTVEALPLTVAVGVQTRAITLSMDVAGVDHTIPAAARYARPWLRTYGADHVTHVGLVEIVDITEAWLADSAAQAGLALKAPLASPSLTGVPTAPTAAPGTETTQIATTAWAAAAARTIAQAAVDALVDAAPEQLATLTALAEALGNDPDFAATITAAIATKADSADMEAQFAALGDMAARDTVGTNDVDERAITLSKMAERNEATFLGRRSGEGLGPVQEVSAAQARASLGIASVDDTSDEDKPVSAAAAAALALKAPLASPALTGVPTVPTAAAGTATAQIASTAFVAAGIDAVAAPVAPDGEMTPLILADGRVALWLSGADLDGPGLSTALARSATRLAAPEAEATDPAAVPVVRDDSGRVLAWASEDGLQWPGMDAWLHARAAPRVSAALTPVGTDGRTLHRHGAKVAHLQSGIAPLPRLRVALLGDSWVGQALIGRALRDRYAAAGLPHTSSGFVHPHPTDNHIDTAVVFSGNWTYANARAGDATPYGVCPTGRCAYTSAAGATLTYSGLVGTTLEIHCHQHGGAWTYSLDGAPAVAVTDASDATLRVVSLAAGAGPHSLVITATAGIVSMLGVYATSASGFELSLLGSSGSEARLTAGWIGAAQGQINRIAPDLLITILGTNDSVSLHQGADPVAHAVHLQTIIGAFRAAGPCGVVCVIPCRSARTDVWPLWAYRDAVLAMALSDGAVEMVSGLDLFGPYAEANALGLWMDNDHLNAIGGARLAALLDINILQIRG